jgi:aldose 1-epimerase
VLQKSLLLRNIFPFPLEQVSINNEVLSLEALNYGAIISKLRFRTGEGSWMDLVIGKDDPQDYLKDPYSIGACVGRYAGRISGGELHIDGKKYPLPGRDGITLHGGQRGFGRKFWKIDSVSNSVKYPEIRLRYLSPHLEEGFPGNLQVAVTYQLFENSLIIRHEAATDRPTVVNLTNHSYFKIDRQPLVSHYRLQLSAQRILETDERLVPTGRLLAVKDTEFDFQAEKQLGDTLLDTPFVLHGQDGHAARVYSPVSGLRLSVYTNQPAVVVYTPEDFPSICLETQNYPDAPRHAHFPSSLLHPGKTYLNESRFVFEKTP